MLFISLSTYATAQEGDVIYIDGVQWILLGKPVYADSVLSRELKEALPKDRGWSTANWSGYTAYWSIWKDKLCLDSVQYMIYDGSDRLGRTESLPSKTLRRLFKKYVEGKRIVATWLDGDIRVAKGKMIYYVHDGYRRNYENERMISIGQGKVRGVKDYQNYVVEGFAFDEYHPEANPPGNFLENAILTFLRCSPCTSSSILNWPVRSGLSSLSGRHRSLLQVIWSIVRLECSDPVTIRSLPLRWPRQ